MVLLLANKACHIKVHTHGQILVTLNVIPASLKQVYAVAEKFTHTLAGSPPPTVIITDYSLKSVILMDYSLKSDQCISGQFPWLVYLKQFPRLVYLAPVSWADLSEGSFLSQSI